jgi:3-methyladenine DNA glycosylase/8-oxoguanine DNA glycosylase
MAEARKVLRRDPAFRPLLKRVEPFELRSRRPYFWTLCTAILAQQVSGAAARTIIGRVRDLIPDRRFPDPQSLAAIPDKKLQGAGVSRQKRRYLYALAEAFGDGGLGSVRWSRLSDEEIMERLTAIVGVGRWTAEMFLIFSMRRPDVFPVDDLGVRHGMGRFFDVDGQGAMIERAERWRPYRSVASLYLWRGLAAEPPT